MSADTRSHVHALIDQLAPPQLSALETLLESLVDPVSRKLSEAPFDDEPLTEEDRAALAASVEWSKTNKPIPLEEVLADFGRTMEDWDRMGRTPLSNG